MSGDVDVVVSDGFSGNVALKTLEGTALSVMKVIKRNILSSFSAKIGYLFMKKAFKKIRAEMDYSKYGGAMLLGIEKVIVKSHGSSKRDSICASILQARDTAENNLVGSVKELMSKVDLEGLEVNEG